MARMSPQNATVVTGAAGALGRAVVDEFRSRGRYVVALDRPGDTLDSLAVPGEVQPIAVDLADRTGVATAFEAVDQLGTTVESLVALAGGYAGGALSEVDEDTLSGLFDTNVASLLWAAQAAAPRMTGGGSIVTVGSRTAVTGAAPLVHGTTKAAVVRLTELLAEDLRAQGIRVNSVLPSVIDTPANRSWMDDDMVARAVTPAAIAKVIAFLCSDDAAPVSGASVPVYGDA
jgi:NAD(P)-dependent dehydrogenase (short-subunit alcohol dehydrogenase family)